MKLKIIPVFMATLMLAGCGNSGESDPTPAPTPTPVPQESWLYLDFMNESNVLRFDLFNIEEGLQLSYGNTALVAGVNKVTMDANSNVTINKNTTEDKNFNAALVAEDGNGHSLIRGHKKIEGDKITTFLETIVKDFFKQYKRGYVAFSMGDEAQWTKGLNSKMDEYFNTVFNN